MAIDIIVTEVAEEGEKESEGEKRKKQTKDNSFRRVFSLQLKNSLLAPLIYLTKKKNKQVKASGRVLRKKYKRNARRHTSS